MAAIESQGSDQISPIRSDWVVTAQPGGADFLDELTVQRGPNGLGWVLASAACF
jgi:hypothetical protein